MNTTGATGALGQGRGTGARRPRASRRAVLGGALAWGGAVGLAACAGPGAGPPAGAPGGGAPAGGAKGKLTWLVRTNPLENPWEQDVVLPAMRERAPGVEIDLQVTADVWNEKVFAMHAGGTPPDVHNGIVGTFIQLYAQEKLLELTPLLARDRVDLRPFGGFEKDPDMCRGARTWSLPVLTTLGNMTFYNADLLEQAGVPAPPTSWQDRTWTWDRVLEIARRTTRGWGQPDAVHGYLPFNQLHPWAYLWGGDPWVKDWYARGIARESAWTTPAVVEAVQFYQDLAHKQQVAPRRGSPVRPFVEGGAALWGTAGWNTSALTQVTLFRWGIAPLPWRVTNKALSFTDGVLATNQTRAPDAAWELIKYLTGREGQLAYSTATARPPARVDAFDPWLEATLALPGARFASKERLREVVTGYLGNHVDNWAHYVVDARRFQDIQTEAENKLLAGEVAAGPLLAEVKGQMEAQLRETYDRFQGSRLTRDALCQ